MTQPTLTQRLTVFAPRMAATVLGAVQYRQAGNTPAQTSHVLLHGIGSGSASWLAQLEAAQSRTPAQTVLAWEAPGYGQSARVTPESPAAQDYAERLWAWLDALGVNHPVTLVGHSLGALMATRAAVLQPGRVKALVLLSPAQGYARATPQDRDKKLSDRLANLAELGPQGMATKRGAAMLSGQASAEQVSYIQGVMAQILPAGYTQAAKLLAHGDLLTDLARIKAPLTVASGSADSITPVAGCQAVAAHGQVAWMDLGPVGHACALEAADAVNTLLGLIPPQAGA